MIEIKQLTIGYKHNILLDGVTTTVGSGRLIALLGRNGCGKSTLLRTLAGLERPLAGEVWLAGQAQSTLSVDAQSRLVSLVTTERVGISNLRVWDVVAMGRAPYTNWLGWLRKEDKHAVMQALGATGMEAYADRTIDRLSDGECQRVMIARALAQDTPIVLLDEPTSFLDLPNRYELCLLLKRVAETHNKCVLFSTHELEIALTLCDLILLIDSPYLYNLPTPEMVRSGHIERLFQNEAAGFDAEAWMAGRRAVRLTDK